MPKGSPKKPIVDAVSARRARGLLGLCLALFALFCVNVLLGKAQIVFGLDLAFLLPDVPEFLLLLFSALFFTLAALAREKAVGTRDGGDAG